MCLVFHQKLRSCYFSERERESLYVSVCGGWVMMQVVVVGVEDDPGLSWRIM